MSKLNNNLDIKDNWDEDDEDVSEISDEEEENINNVTESIVIPKKKTKNLKEKISVKEQLEAKKSIESSSLPKSAEINNVVNGTSISIDSFEPSTKEDYKTFADIIKEKFAKLEKSTDYIVLLENLFKNLVKESEAEDIKKLLTIINAVSNEKSKLIKGTKPKKKPKKVSLMTSKTNDLDDLTIDYDNFDDDFM